MSSVPIKQSVEEKAKSVEPWRVEDHGEKLLFAECRVRLMDARGRSVAKSWAEPGNDVMNLRPFSTVLLDLPLIKDRPCLLILNDDELKKSQVQ